MLIIREINFFLLKVLKGSMTTSRLSSRRQGVTDLVTKLDTVSRTEVIVSINKIAGSHMTRHTFIGNIYKLVKDPNLVSALTGHVEGSRAFTRYRTIDIDMKKDLVKILEGKKLEDR